MNQLFLSAYCRLYPHPPNGGDRLTLARASELLEPRYPGVVPSHCYSASIEHQALIIRSRRASGCSSAAIGCRLTIGCVSWTGHNSRRRRRHRTTNDQITLVDSQFRTATSEVGGRNPESRRTVSSRPIFRSFVKRQDVDREAIPFRTDGDTRQNVHLHGCDRYSNNKHLCHTSEVNHHSATNILPILSTTAPPLLVVGTERWRHRY